MSETYPFFTLEGEMTPYSVAHEITDRSQTLCEESIADKKRKCRELQVKLDFTK